MKDKIVTNDRWGEGIACHHGGYYTCTDRYDPGKFCDILVFYLVVLCEHRAYSKTEGKLTNVPNTQLYFHDKVPLTDIRLLRLKECISDIERWMSSNRLRLNTDESDSAHSPSNSK